MDELSTIHFFFEALLKTKGDAIDKQQIMNGCEAFHFRTVSKRFKMIDDKDSAVVYVPTGDNGQLLQALRSGGYNRETIRRLQQDSISVSVRLLEDLCLSGAIERTADDFFILTDPQRYSGERGLLTQSDRGMAFFI